MSVFLIELHDLFIGTGKAHFLILLAQINQIAFHCFDEEFFLSTRNEKFRAILSLLPRFLDQ